MCVCACVCVCVPVCTCVCVPQMLSFTLLLGRYPPSLPVGSTHEATDRDTSLWMADASDFVCESSSADQIPVQTRKQIELRPRRTKRARAPEDAVQCLSFLHMAQTRSSLSLVLSHGLSVAGSRCAIHQRFPDLVLTVTVHRSAFEYEASPRSEQHRTSDTSPCQPPCCS